MGPLSFALSCLLGSFYSLWFFNPIFEIYFYSKCKNTEEEVEEEDEEEEEREGEEEEKKKMERSSILCFSALRTAMAAADSIQNQELFLDLLNGYMVPRAYTSLHSFSVPYTAS